MFVYYHTSTKHNAIANKCQHTIAHSVRSVVKDPPSIVHPLLEHSRHKAC